MCEIETVIFVAALIWVATGFCIYQANSDKKVGHHSKIKSQCPYENEYKMYCLNGGECYYLVDEDTVGWKCTWLYGGKRRTCGGTRLEVKVEKDDKFLN